MRRPRALFSSLLGNTSWMPRNFARPQFCRRWMYQFPPNRDWIQVANNQFPTLFLPHRDKHQRQSLRCSSVPVHGTATNGENGLFAEKGICIVQTVSDVGVGTYVAIGHGLGSAYPGLDSGQDVDHGHGWHNWHGQCGTEYRCATRIQEGHVMCLPCITAVRRGSRQLG